MGPVLDGRQADAELAGDGALRRPAADGRDDGPTPLGNPVALLTIASGMGAVFSQVYTASDRDVVAQK
jgi:hypothetical protein